MSPFQYIYRWSIAVVMLVFIPLSSFKGPVKKKETVKWAVQKTSSLKIEGSSNVNQFVCDVQGYFQTDTISFTSDEAGRVVPLKGALTIDVAGFDCHNRMLTKDLRKTLKATEYPWLIVRFVALERSPVFQNNRDNLKGVVEIELAGVCKRFEINYVIEKTGGSIMLNGGRTFNFSDFMLTAPKKLAGAIRVRDNFNVLFRLNLQQVS